MGRRPLAVAVVLSILAIAGAISAFAITRGGGDSRLEAACPQGYITRAAADRRERREERALAGYRKLNGKQGESERDRERTREHAGEAKAESNCVRSRKPETFRELAVANSGLANRSSAPFTGTRRGAYEHAIAQKAAIANEGASGVPGADGSWSPYGEGPLTTDNTDYDQSNGSTNEGFGVVSGRVADYAYDAGSGRLWSAASNGGVWQSDDMGGHWHSIGDNLPTQVVSSVKFSPAEGGTLLVLTGDGSFGFDSLSGLGVYRSTDGGATWQKGQGVPDGVLGFKIAVDPSNPNVAYAATGDGLYRSGDDGRTWTNVQLPTGNGVGAGQPNCTGTSTVPSGCFLANMVTDVVVQAGDSGHGGHAGAVMAIVGWRAGVKPDSDGTVQSPGNGVYTSDDGTPGSFAKQPSGGTSGFPSESGRVELGIANGPAQDHRIVYAVVEDATKFNGGVPGIDAEGATGAPYPTVLKGIYVSSDFGQSWTEMADAAELALPGSGSSLAGAGCAQLYCPGVQAWYNQWIQPDPTKQDASGVPTRVLFGLEEIWENRLATAQNGHSSFKVIGRYFGGSTCAFLNSPLPVCPGNDPPTPSTTTHPDQHGAVFVPDGSGGVTVVVGNDGGTYKQTVGSAADFSNANWGRGANGGYHTLQPYDAEMSKDGTVYAGLQDNGEMKILPDGRQFAVFGGDGFYTAVDPNNSDVAYEEYTAGDISVTTDGGKNWTDIAPPLTSAQFSNPFTMDPGDAKHLMAPARDIYETTYGPDTGSQLNGSKDWKKVYDLGTQQHPGDGSASSSATDPDNQSSAVDLRGDAAYIGYCGYCDTITQGTPFASGIATNVGGPAAPKRMTGDGWHIAKAEGLPERYVTSVAMDPSNPRTVYVTLAGYGRHWAPPGAIKDDTSKVGTGHVFKSTDAGEHFTDITGGLPDVPADYVVVRGGQLVVATDIGVFASSDTSGTSWALLGKGLPTVPVYHLQLKPGDPDTLVAATYGRGVYTYHFSTAPTARASGLTACKAASSGFRRFTARMAKGKLKVGLSRKARAAATVDVIRHTIGLRRVIKPHRIKRFRKVTKSLSWRKRLPDGIYSVRASMTIPGTKVRDVRSRTFQIKNGRYSGQRDYFGHASCGTVASFRLSGPAFGGSTGKRLTASYRLSKAARVQVKLRRGQSVVKSFRPSARKAGKTYRVTMRPRGLAPGTYTVLITAVRGKAHSTVTLASKRL